MIKIINIHSGFALTIIEGSFFDWFPNFTTFFRLATVQISFSLKPFILHVLVIFHLNQIRLTLFV